MRLVHAGPWSSHRVWPLVARLTAPRTGADDLREQVFRHVSSQEGARRNAT